MGSGTRVPGEQQPESDHNFQGDRTEAGVFKDRHWRHAQGWFSYDLKNPDKNAKVLRVTYYGRDSGRNFDIYLNDFLLETVKLDGTSGDKFIDVDYSIPLELIRKFSGKPLKVKFAAHPNSTAGGIYYLRLLK